MAESDISNVIKRTSWKWLSAVTRLLPISFAANRLFLFEIIISVLV